MPDVGFPSNIVRDVLIIFQDIGPKFSGNTVFNGTQTRLINEGFEVVLIESITPYGVKLDQVPTPGWAKNSRKTGRPLKGWFTVDCKNAGMLYIRGVGGYHTGMNVVRTRIAEEAIDNPLRQRIFAQHVAERGDSDVDIT